MNVRLVHSAENPPESPQKVHLIRTLRGLLQDTFRMRNEGVVYSKLAHSQGYADGYMRILVDGGHVTQHELLDIVREVRRGVDGPATGSIAADSESVA